MKKYYKFKPIKTALIFGGSSGVGLAIALKFAREGVAVVIASRSEEKLKKAMIRLKKIAKSSVYSISCDISKFDEVNKTIAEVEKKIKQIDCLINSAGVSIHGEISELNEQDYDEVININLKGMFNVARAVWLGMEKTRTGQIISISSASGLGGYPTGSIYCASKAGVNSFMESLAVEGKESGIRVLNICPGQIDTPIWNKKDSIINKARSNMLNPGSVADLLWYIVNRPANEFFPKIVIQPFKPQPNFRGRNRGSGGLFKNV